jgi:16S rRNA A1518/A1519 N6-dimethyltransferase RsmA/KsgA/DIM1 with predicted DNA glycosylase/AP lyase activity
VAERKTRARRLAGRISLAATVLMAAYVALRMAGAPMARLYGAIAVLATYIIVRRIATRIAMEYLK